MIEAAFAVGYPSPFGRLPDGDGTVIEIDASGGFVLVVQLAGNAAAAISSVLRGRLTVGVVERGSTAIFVWRFEAQSGRLLVELDTPFHLGLYPSEARDLMDPQMPGTARQVIVVTQDHRGIVKGLRSVTLPSSVSEAVDHLLAIQQEEASAERWMPTTHFREVGLFQRRWGQSGGALSAATVRGVIE